MAAVVNIDGRVYPEAEARVSVFDHGFVYGEGVYETIRTYHRTPFLFDRHIHRLRNSAALIALDVPVSDDEMLQRVRTTLTALGGSAEAYIRILVTRGVGDLTYDLAATPRPTVVIIVKPHTPPPDRHYTDGIPVSLVPVVRNYVGSINPLIKSNNLLNNALAQQEAIRRGSVEALMCNVKGELAECSQSNFFLVRGGTVLTPEAACGLLPGVTRQLVFEMGEELGVPVEEAILGPEDLDTADETFLTSTTREITPIVRIDARTIGSGRPGPITRRLMEAFHRRAQGAVATAPSVSR